MTARGAWAAKSLAIAAKQRLFGFGASRLLAAGAALVLGLVIWSLTGRDQTEARAGALLDQGQAAAALELVGLSKERNEPAMRLLKAEGMHQLKRHREEWDLVAGTNAAGLEKLRPSELVALLEDFVKLEREDGPRTTLARLPAVQQERMKKWAGGEQSAAQWGAVRYLDFARTAGVDLVPGYITSLLSTDCNIAAGAARRLQDLGDARAIEPLERLKGSPKKQGLFFGESCGHDEAEAALQKLSPPLKE